MNNIKKIVEQILKIVNIEAEIEIKDDLGTNLTFFTIQTKEPNLLIGYKGETLSALSHILKKISDANNIREEEKSVSTEISSVAKPSSAKSLPTGRRGYGAAKPAAAKSFGAAKQQFIIDVNGYQKKRIDEIKDKATILVERARYYKSSVDMDPMSPYERMIVHSVFSQDQQIKTESAGEGRERHVVIKYIRE